MGMGLQSTLGILGQHQTDIRDIVVSTINTINRVVRSTTVLLLHIRTLQYYNVLLLLPTTTINTAFINRQHFCTRCSSSFFAMIDKKNKLHISGWHNKQNDIYTTRTY